MKMKEFAQLADFIIRYVDVEAKLSLSKYKLDNAVGLNPERPYPQVIYIPNNPKYCKSHLSLEEREEFVPILNELVFVPVAEAVIVAAEGVERPE